MRIFYALPLPEETAEALFNASLSLRGRLLGGSVTPKENLHVTVSFVGNVNELKTDILTESCAKQRRKTVRRNCIFASRRCCAARI